MNLTKNQANARNLEEYILCAAIRRIRPRAAMPYHPGTNDICDIEIGMRHHDIFHRFPGAVSKHPDDQGFYTSKGRFVSREEGAEIAWKNGQLAEPTRVLYSEDIY